MKGYFSEVVKYFLKSEKIMVQRVEDFYFICNGYAALKLPAAFYKGEFFTASGLFSELESGEGLTIRPAYSESDKAASVFNVAQFFTVKDERPLEALPVLVELPKTQSRRSKKAQTAPARLLYCSEYVTALNTENLKCFGGLGCKGVVGGASPFGPVVFRGAVFESEFLIMPVRVGDQYKDILRKIGGRV